MMTLTGSETAAERQAAIQIMLTMATTAAMVAGARVLVMCAKKSKKGVKLLSAHSWPRGSRCGEARCEEDRYEEGRSCEEGQYCEEGHCCEEYEDADEDAESEADYRQS
jgi:hypothetical protein